MKKLTPAERLIVAADFKPTSPHSNSAKQQVQVALMGLCQVLQGTGVYLKVNSALRAVGYRLIDMIHDHGLKCFADLKLFDISETLATDGAILEDSKPELLTVACATGMKSMKRLRDALPQTEVLGVTILTDYDDEECRATYGGDVAFMVDALAQKSKDAGLGGIICSPKEAPAAREILGMEMTINTPGVRPLWSLVPGDDQNPERVLTPFKAIKAGTNRIVVGRPILGAKDRLDAVNRIVDEIASAMN